MADELRTEEEQIAAIKNWWKENGNSVLTAVLLSVAAIFGWKGYQSHLVEKKSGASSLFSQLVQVESELSAGGEEGDQGVAYIAGQLKSDYADTEYALYGALFLAKDAVRNEAYDEAVSELKWVVENSEDPRLDDIAHGRMARVLSQQGKHDEALAVLIPQVPEFEGSFAEIKGDIKNRQGDKEGAIEAYKVAYQAASDSPLASFIQIKLSSLGVDVEELASEEMAN